MIAPHRVCYASSKLMQHQGRWRSRTNWFIPVASNTLVFEKFLSFVLRGQLASDDTQFLQGDPVDQTLTVLAGRLGQSDATACGLHITCLLVTCLLVLH